MDAFLEELRKFQQSKATTEADNSMTGTENVTTSSESSTTTSSVLPENTSMDTSMDNSSMDICMGTDGISPVKASSEISDVDVSALNSSSFSLSSTQLPPSPNSTLTEKLKFTCFLLCVHDDKVFPNNNSSSVPIAKPDHSLDSNDFRPVQCMESFLYFVFPNPKIVQANFFKVG